MNQVRGKYTDHTRDTKICSTMQGCYIQQKEWLICSQKSCPAHETNESRLQIASCPFHLALLHHTIPTFIQHPDTAAWMSAQSWSTNHLCPAVWLSMCICQVMRLVAFFRQHTYLVRWTCTYAAYCHVTRCIRALAVWPKCTFINGDGGGHTLGRGTTHIRGPQGIMLKCLSTKTYCSQKFGHNRSASILSILP